MTLDAALHALARPATCTGMKRQFLFTWLLACLLFPLDGRTVSGKPNVILIMADDLGYQDLGVYGHPTLKTPVLDQLAREGVRLTSFYSGATVCTPSRMALLTGAYPPRLGWRKGVVGFKMGARDGMHPKALTLAEVFQSEGYATAISGKWHLGNQPNTRPHQQGFDSAYYIDMSNNQTKKLWRKDAVIEEPFENRLLTEQFTTEAIRFIRETQMEAGSQPFFLYLPYSAPHFPVQAHPDWKGKSAFGVYGDVVEELDARIGEIRNALKELKIDQRTIIVFLSDNGPNPNEKASCLPYRGEKWSALEGGTRVPCIVHWPGKIPAGRASDNLVAAIDLLPTLCHACGIDWKAKSKGAPKIDGVNVWGTLCGESEKHPRTELLFWHGMEAEPQAIRVGEWKLFFNRRHALEGLGTRRMSKAQAEAIKAYREELKPASAELPMLFHLKTDAGETQDRSEAQPERVKAMRKRAEELMADIRSHPILPIASP